MATKLMFTRTRTAIPTPREAAEARTTQAWDRSSLPPPPVEDAISYLDFFYGFGAGRELDLGLPKRYIRVPTRAGSVFREDFERGVALCNCGQETAEVTLEKPYRDRAGTLRTTVPLPDRSVVVLFPQQ